MLIYTLKRLLYVTPVVIGVSIICFLLVHIAPGDPLSAILPADATQELVDQMRAEYGFDKPLPVQYALWFWKVVHGDLGTSIATGRTVASEVMRAVGNTLILATVATAIGFTFGMVWYGWQVVDTAQMLDQRSSSDLLFPLWIYYAALPTGGLLMLMRYVIRLLRYAFLFDPATMTVGRAIAHEVPAALTQPIIE